MFMFFSPQSNVLLSNPNHNMYSLFLLRSRFRLETHHLHHPHSCCTIHLHCPHPVSPHLGSPKVSIKVSLVQQYTGFILGKKMPRFDMGKANDGNDTKIRGRNLDSIYERCATLRQIELVEQHVQEFEVGGAIIRDLIGTCISLGISCVDCGLK